LFHSPRGVSPPPADVAGEAAIVVGVAGAALAPPAGGLAGAADSAGAPPAAQVLGALELPPEGAARTSGRLVADL